MPRMHAGARSFHLMFGLRYIGRHFEIKIDSIESRFHASNVVEIVSKPTNGSHDSWKHSTIGRDNQAHSGKYRRELPRTTVGLLRSGGKLRSAHSGGRRARLSVRALGYLAMNRGRADGLQTGFGMLDRVAAGHVALRHQKLTFGSGAGGPRTGLVA